MTKITKDQAIAAVGDEAISRLLYANVEPTNRVTTDGTVELSARVNAQEDGEDVTVFMYVLFDADEFNACEDLDALDWDRAVAEARFEIY